MYYSAESKPRLSAFLADPLNTVIGAALFLTSMVIAAALLGIHSRPLGLLANVWPANAIMLGILLRLPAAASPLGWIGGFLGFVSADLLTGADIYLAGLLNFANIVGIATAFAIFQLFPRKNILLNNYSSVFYMIAAAAGGSFAAGIVGGISNPVLFNRPMLSGSVVWSVTEFANYVAFLPVMLALPKFEGILLQVRLLFSIRWSRMLPLVALVASCLAMVFIGGPGGIAFPVPALLWCSLVYPLFPITILTLLVSMVTLLSPGISLVTNGINFGNETSLISFRLGVSLLTLGPIVLAAVIQVQKELLRQLQYIAHHDTLTDVNNRAALTLKASRIMAQAKQPYSFMALDLDRFKSINDTYGHQAGDHVLRTFAQRARSVVRSYDVLARIGGEEFVLMSPNCTKTDAIKIAERIRQLCAAPIALPDKTIITVTVSVGLVSNEADPNRSLEQLLDAADRLLYKAKENGRNRIEME